MTSLQTLLNFILSLPLLGEMEGATDATAL